LPLGRAQAGTKDKIVSTDAYLASESEAGDFRFGRFAVGNLLEEYQMSDVQSAITATRMLTEQHCDSPKVKGHLRVWAKCIVKTRQLRAKTVRWNKYVGFKVSNPDSEEEFRQSTTRPASSD
jgi:hypothetical protein